MTSFFTSDYMKSDTLKKLFPIFLTVFIDMVGVGVIIPVIPALFFKADSTFFAATVTREWRSILFGFLIASYPFMQFFGAPALGALSDRFGRKPMIIISLIGTMIGYLLFGIAIHLNNLPLLFFSRMLPGFTGGNISIIYSAISDVSNENTRTANFGLVGVSFGLGFILGPALGGILADNTVVSWFDHSTPFWFTAILTLFNILLVLRNFDETLLEKRHTEITFTKGFQNIFKSFSAPELKTIFTVVLLVSLGFSFFTQFFSVFMFTKFDYGTKETGLLFGWVGIWLVFTQGFIVRKLVKTLPPRKIMTVSILGLSFAIAALLLPDKAWMFYLINPFIAIFQGMTSPNMTAIVSSRAGAQRQGEMLGINQSMISVGQIIPPLLGGYFSAINVGLPMMVAAFLIFLAWVVFVFIFK